MYDAFKTVSVNESLDYQWGKINPILKGFPLTKIIGNTVLFRPP